jgi:hypothetical protein
MVEHPDPKHALLVSRVDYAPDAHEWEGNEDDAGEHHGLLNGNEVPCFIARSWNSRSAGRTVRVGTFKLYLRRLVQAGYAADGPNRKVRVRFVRDPNGTICLRRNDSSPGIAVGFADFSRR